MRPSTALLPLLLALGACGDKDATDSGIADDTAAADADTDDGRQDGSGDEGGGTGDDGSGDEGGGDEGGGSGGSGGSGSGGGEGGGTGGDDGGGDEGGDDGTTDPNTVTLGGVDFTLEIISGTASFSTTADGVDLTTDGQALLVADADGVEGLQATFAQSGGGDRVGLGIDRSDGCGNDVQHVVASQIQGNQKGWQYTCDYLHAECGLDDIECGSPLGNTADLTSGPVTLGVWIDAAGDVYQLADTSAGQELSLSDTAQQAEPGSSTNTTLSVLVVAQGSNTTISITDVSVGAHDAATFAGAEFAGACRGADLTCD